MPKNPEVVPRQRPDQSPRSWPAAPDRDAEGSAPQPCPVCSKTNPATAYYCHHDGTPLTKDAGQGPIPVANLPFPMPFYFSDGQACASFNQLALTCASHWDEACALLTDGIWAAWFRTLGRLDLATVANQAAAEPDRDAGLSQLLSHLPADPEYLRPPKLALESGEVNLGQLTPGADLSFDVVIYNQGMLMLRGSIWTDCEWLVLGHRTGPSQKLVQTRNVCTVPVYVLGHKLRAGLKPIEGGITLETNGGRLTVPVRAFIPVRPFPRGPAGNDVLTGARSPRDLAVRAKAHPREAAVLFERGLVKAWYASNGWTYPVEGSEGSGVGAVQQFFEALGLTQPPKLSLDPVSLVFRGRIGERIATSLTVRTAESKPVYAQAWSNRDWVSCGPNTYLGNKVKIGLEILVPPAPGQTLQAQVTIRGNGNQIFAVLVFLTVEEETVPAAAPGTIRKGVGALLRGFLGER